MGRLQPCFDGFPVVKDGKTCVYIDDDLSEVEKYTECLRRGEADDRVEADRALKMGFSW